MVSATLSWRFILKQINMPESKWFSITLPRDNLEIIFNQLKNGNLNPHCLNRNTGKIVSFGRSYTPDKLKALLKQIIEDDLIHGIYGKNPEDTINKIKALFKKAKNKKEKGRNNKS